MNAVSGPYTDAHLPGLVVHVVGMEHASRPRHMAIVTSDDAAWLPEEQKAGMFDSLIAFESSIDNDDDQRVWLYIEAPAPGGESRRLESAWLDLPGLGAPHDTSAAVLEAIGGPVDLVAEGHGILLGEWSAFLLDGEFGGERRMVCLVTQSEPRPPCIDGLMARWYFQRVLRQGTAGFAGGSSVPVWIHRTDSHGLEAMSVGTVPLVAYVPTAQTSDDIAAEIMRDSLMTVRTRQGVVRLGAAQPGGMHSAVGHRHGSTLETIGWVAAGADPETFFRDEPSDKTNALAYLGQVLGYLHLGRPRLAFRAYYYYLRFARFTGLTRRKRAREAVELGFAVLRLLDEAKEEDYVEWIGGAIADLAYRHGLDEQGADALWHAGVAASALGWSDRCVTHFDRALVTGRLSRHERARLQMSYGICLLEFCAGRELDAPLDKRHRGYVDQATSMLRHAVEGYRRLPRERAEWPLHSIALELARAADLRGEHSAAAEQLRRLAERPVIAGDLALFSTAVVYSLLAMRALTEYDAPERREYLRYCLELAKATRNSLACASPGCTTCYWPTHSPRPATAARRWACTASRTTSRRSASRPYLTRSARTVRWTAGSGSTPLTGSSVSPAMPGRP